MNIEEHKQLKNLNTFSIDSYARYFCRISSVEELQEALQWTKARSIPFFILGGGSNILLTQKEYPGLMLMLDFNEIIYEPECIIVGAGVRVSDLIEDTLAHGYIGMEFAAGIPGSIGGGIRGNAGTFGVSFSDIIDSVIYFDYEQMKVLDISKQFCEFSYRHSIFKQRPYIILKAAIRLTKGFTDESKKIINERIAVRKSQHPLEPSAGCIFKNIELSKVDTRILERNEIDIEPFKKFNKIPTGYLIEKLNLKGKQIGGAKISEKHGNYIVNTGNASPEDIITLISYIKQQVRDTYGIQLEEEVQIVP